MKFKLLGALGLLAGAISLVAINSTVEAKNDSLTRINTPKEYFNNKYYSTTIPEGYYDSVDLNLTDDNFRRNLYDIISKGYKKHSYKDNNTVLRYTDPDPAQATNPSLRGNVIGFYSGDSINGWNKEHVWAKSHGFPEKGYSSSEPYSDAHHLRPTYNNINSRRSNYDFGEIPEGQGSPDKYGNQLDGGAFEPREEVKGDVARIMFYMATRYGSKTQFNLKLVEARTTSPSALNGRFGGLNDLLRWHYDDPVSKEEIYRNNVIYEEFQHNRNPYIDHPEYVDYAFPNEYSNLPIDEVKVSQVKVLIENLPATITLNDKAIVMEAKNAYDALNYSEKKLVTNYSKLDAAYNKILELDKPVNPEPEPDPENPEVKPDTEFNSDVSLSFIGLSGGASGSYTKNSSFNVGDYSFFASDIYVTKNETRIGHNKTSSSLSKFNLSTKGSYLESKFDVLNATSFELEILKWYGDSKSWKVYFTEKGSTEYELLASGSSNLAKATLKSPRTGHFTVVFEGNMVRASVGACNIKTGTEVAPNPDYSSFESLSPKASIIAEYKNGSIITAKLRFGGVINDKALKDSSDFGIILMPTRELNNKDIRKYFADINLSDLKTNSSYIVKSFNDKASITANGYQLGLVAKNLANRLDLSLSASYYAVIDGKLYISNTVATSFSSELIKYANTLPIDEKNTILDLLK